MTTNNKQDNNNEIETFICYFDVQTNCTMKCSMLLQFWFKKKNDEIVVKS